MMFVRRIYFIIGLMIITAGCQTTIAQEDIFRPYDASGNSVSLTRKDDPVIVNNIPRPNLWNDLNVTHKDGILQSDTIKIAYRLSRQMRDDAPLFVYCNGNSSDIPNHGDLNSYKITSFGDLLQWDYPGYGKSEGRANFEDVKLASQTLINAVQNMKRRPSQTVIFWGYSLGGFVCADMVSRSDDVAGLIFEAGAPSARATESYLVPKVLRLFIKAKMPKALRNIDNVKVLDRTRHKILVLSGAKDKVLPVTLSRDLSAQLKKAGHSVTYHEFADADHFSISWQDEFESAVEAFILGL